MFFARIRRIFAKPSQPLTEEQTATVKSLSDQVAEICNAIDPEFWVPGVANGMIGNFVAFIFNHNLVRKMQQFTRGYDDSESIWNVCYAHGAQSLDVPAVGNHQIGAFVQFVNSHNLWNQFSELVNVSAS